MIPRLSPFRKWLATWIGNGTGAPSRTPKAAKARPRLEVLEDRLAPAGLDFGDAPLSYGEASHGATGPMLGVLRDAEDAALVSADAWGDNSDGDDDEDGVMLTNLVVGSRATWIVQTRPVGLTQVLLRGWLDLNHDGVFSDDSERILDYQISALGNHEIYFNIPANAVPGETFVRFRISTESTLTPTGFAKDGEVEDYRVQILPLSVIDAGGELHYSMNAFAGHADREVEFNVSHHSDPTLYQANDHFIRYPDAAGYRENLYGLNEKWLYSESYQSWYFLTPSGTLRRYNGESNPADSQIQGSYPSIVWHQPSLLHEGKPVLDPTSFAVATLIDPIDGDFTTTAPLNFERTYLVIVSAQGAQGRALNTFHVLVENDPPVLEPIADRTMRQGQTLNFDVSASDPNASQSVSYSIFGVNTDLAFDLYYLPRGFMKPADAGGYRENLHVPTTKWLYHTNLKSWFYLLSDGSLHQYTGETPVAAAPIYRQLSPLVWEDPTLLIDPRLPSNAAFFVTTAIDSTTGNVQITASADYSGLVSIWVTASDGFHSVIQKFHVLVTYAVDKSDAPASFGVATHQTVGPVLGILRDGDEAALASADALGDDQDGAPDEDGLILTNLVVGGSARWAYQVSEEPGRLDAWIDFNRDGVFDPVGERITPTAGLPLNLHNSSFDFTVPGTAIPGETFARFRLSRQGGLNPTGAASDGEVEDYRITLLPTPYLNPGGAANLDINAFAGNSDREFTFSVSQSTGDLASNLRSFDSQYDLIRYDDALGYRQNAHGMNEKWLYSRSQSVWVYLTPDGGLYHYRSGDPRLALRMALLHPWVWENPEFLHSPFSSRDPNTVPITADIDSETGALAISVPDGYLGISEELIQAQGSFGFAHIHFPLLVDQPKPTLAPIQDKLLSLGETLKFDVEASADPSLTVSYSISQSVSALGTQLYNSGSHFIKPPDAAGYRENLHVHTAKWLYNTLSNTWYYLLSNGELHHYTGQADVAAAPVVKMFSPLVWQDPRLLIAPTAPLNPEGRVTTTINAETGAVQIVPGADFVGLFDVTVTASAGSRSVQRTFTVAVVNDPVTIDPIADRRLYFRDTLEIAPTARDADVGQVHTWSMTVSTDGAAYQLDQQLGLIRLPDTAGYRENLHVPTAKWLFSTVQNVWYFLLSDGTLHRYGGESVVADAPVVAVLSRIYWEDPFLLHDAVAPINLHPNLTVGQLDTQTGRYVLEPSQVLGVLRVRLTVSDGATSTTTSFLVATYDHPPVIDPIADITLSAGQDNLRFTVTGTDADAVIGPNDARFFVDVKPYSAAYDLDRQLGLSKPADAAGYREGLHVPTAKWLYGTVESVWYFLLADGTLHRYNGEADVSTSRVVASLPPLFWEDPALLHEASVPQDPDAAPIYTTINFLTGELLINPPNGFRGIFEVVVRMSVFGIQGEAESFLVNWR